MSFRGRRRMTAPVRSIKHVVDSTSAVIGAATVTVDLINTVDDPSRASSNNVANGSRVNAVFLRVEAVHVVDGTGVENLYMIVFKNPSNAFTPPAVDGVGVSDVRRFVIHQEMIMTGTNGSTAGAANIPRTMFKGVIMIPKHFRRNGIDDSLELIIGHRAGATVQRTDICVQCIYKEFR